MKKKPACAPLLNIALSLDQFKQPVELILPDNQRRYRTNMGACFSLWMFVTLIGYAFYKMDNLLSYYDYKLQEALQEDYFSVNETMVVADGL